MLQPPTEQEWEDFVSQGGANGATFAPDFICLVRIAGTNEYPPLPADLHDYRYWVGGTEFDRLEADVEFWVNLRKTVAYNLRLWPKRVWLAIAAHRCLTYFRAVEEFGSSHFKYR